MEAQEEALGEWAQTERRNHLDRLVDLAYRENAGVRRELEDRFFSYLLQYAEIAGDTPETRHNLNTLKREFQNYMEALIIVHEAHVSNAQRREQYIAFETDLEELVRVARGLLFIATVVSNNNIRR
jgi:hypothetical protein